MKFIDRAAPGHIAVEGQDLEVEFAFIAPVGDEGDMTNISYWSVCRDFLGDTVCATADKKTVSIYGFTHDGKNNPIHPSYTLLGMKFPDYETFCRFHKNFSRYKKWITATVNPRHKSMTITWFEEELVAVIKADKIWQQTTVNISLFSFILKGLCWDITENLENPIDGISTTEKSLDSPTKEARYALGYVEDITKLLKNLKALTDAHEHVHGWSKKDEHISRIHNNSGFYFAVRWKQDTVVGKWFKEQAAQ